MMFWAACLLTGAQGQVSTRAQTTITTTLPLLPDHYRCDTRSCALHDEFVSVNFTNSTDVCDRVQGEMADGFVKTGPQQCRVLKNYGLVYKDCRKHYCEMYEAAMRKLVWRGGPTYYGGQDDQCRSLMDFNHTLCESDYRDAEVFCDCLCPMLPLLTASASCETEIFQFLLIGRRSPELVERFPMTEMCALSLCVWLETIGNPVPVNLPDIPGGVPPSCHKFDIPFRKEQCKRMVVNYDADLGGKVPYQPCPWLDPGPGLVDDRLECTDGSYHWIDIREVDSWSACVNSNFRWRCPANYPVMCDGQYCDGLADSCCTTSVERCDTGEERKCSILLMMDVPEWRGILTPQAALGRVTTTTIDPLEAYLARTTTTLKGPNISAIIEDVLPFVIAGLAGLGAIAGVVICLFVYQEHFQAIAKTITGGARLMKAIQTDPVEVYAPSEPPKDPKGHGELPPARPWHLIQKELEDQAACAELQDAVDAAYQRGFRGLVAYHGCPPLAEEEPLHEAMAFVRDRGIEAMEGNAALLERGEKWLRTLAAERYLMQATVDARPELHYAGKSQQPLSDGTPWLCTRAGAEHNGMEQAHIWSKVEHLAEAIKVGKKDGAQDSLIQAAITLLAELKARTHELPADRCVLDPEGEGLKVLGRGQFRAMLQTTGQAYLYNADSMKAGDVEDEPPPREDLGDCDVDNARPVCAEWAKHRRCKAGRRCPWRHAVPLPGDTIRECILRDDDR